jgi:hypothetical protein
MRTVPRDTVSPLVDRNRSPGKNSCARSMLAPGRPRDGRLVSWIVTGGSSSRALAARDRACREPRIARNDSVRRSRSLRGTRHSSRLEKAGCGVLYQPCPLRAQHPPDLRAATHRRLDRPRRSGDRRWSHSHKRGDHRDHRRAPARFARPRAPRTPTRTTGIRPDRSPSTPIALMDFGRLPPRPRCARTRSRRSARRRAR